MIQFAAFAKPAEAAGVDPAGRSTYSADAGATWTQKGRIDGEVQAIAAVKGADGNPGCGPPPPRGSLSSTDGGATFRPSDAS